MAADYKSLNALMRHMRTSAGITVKGSSHKKSLAQIGYFHGYKGYRYSGDPSRRIAYTHFDELVAVFTFDTELKALFYPVLMRLEMTMKNLALVEMLDAAGSSSLPVVYRRLMPGNRKGGHRGKLEAIHKDNAQLLAAYKRTTFVEHYYGAPRQEVPLWALMEVITLGHFGSMLDQLSPAVLQAVAEGWGLKRRDADLLPRLVLAITQLRNGVAHNATIYDTRFASGDIRHAVSGLLKREMGFPPTARFTFQTITDYFALVVYLSCCMGFPKREVKSWIRQFVSLTDALQSSVPVSVFDVIVHTDNRLKTDELTKWVTAQ